MGEGRKYQDVAQLTSAKAEQLRQQGDIAGANRLELEAQDYRQRSQQYTEVSQDPKLRDQKGDGYIAAGRLTPQELTERYGRLLGPIPTSVSGPTGIKEFEHVDGDRNKPVIRNPDLQILEPGQRALPLEVGKEYLWVIDSDGRARIGTETVLDPDRPREKLGHPTLVNGEPVRMGGEIKFDPDTQEWNINSASGRYGRDRDKEGINRLLDNSRELFREAGLDVGVDYPEAQ